MRAVLLALLIFMVGCAKGDQVHLNGAGATFPYPLYSKWISEYHKTVPGVSINYQSIGSGGGIRQILEGTVDFGASDAPMNDEEMAQAKSPILHIPTTLGAVAVVYNVPLERLQLTPDVLADIFLGTIKRWDDARIRAINPTLSLPAADIVVVHRSDGSGTTAVFTEYLARVSPAWKQKVGAGKSVNWPVGLGGKGNEGVTGQVKTTPMSIGYIELAYALQTNLPYAELRNQAGKMVKPTPEGMTAAAAAYPDVPEDLRMVIVDAPGEASYPLTSFTYILVHQQHPDPRKGEALAKFLWWATHEGQKETAPLHYAPLPADMVTRVEAKLRSLTQP